MIHGGLRPCRPRMALLPPNVLDDIHIAALPRRLVPPKAVVRMHASLDAAASARDRTRITKD